VLTAVAHVDSNLSGVRPRIVKLFYKRYQIFCAAGQEVGVEEAQAMAVMVVMAWYCRCRPAKR
jgi:hypothetical protein